MDDTVLPDLSPRDTGSDLGDAPDEGSVDDTITRDPASVDQRTEELAVEEVPSFDCATDGGEVSLVAQPEEWWTPAVLAEQEAFLKGQVFNPSGRTIRVTDIGFEAAEPGEFEWSQKPSVPFAVEPCGSFALSVRIPPGTPGRVAGWIVVTHEAGALRIHIEGNRATHPICWIQWDLRPAMLMPQLPDGTTRFVLMRAASGNCIVDAMGVADCAIVGGKPVCPDPNLPGESAWFQATPRYWGEPGFLESSDPIHVDISYKPGKVPTSEGLPRYGVLWVQAHEQLSGDPMKPFVPDLHEDGTTSWPSDVQAHPAP